MFKKLWHLFQARRRYCRLWLPQEAQTLKAPGLPAVDLAVIPIEPEPIPVVPGTLLAKDRAKKGLKTIKLEPMSFPWLPDDHQLNTRPKSQMSFDDTLNLLVPETVPNLPRVKEFHEKRNH